MRYAARCELRGVEGRHRLHLHQLDQDVAFTHDADVVILATGYAPAPLPVPHGLLELDAAGRPVVELDYRLRLADGSPSTLFVQNAELHTHGVGTPDLGLGAHRSAVIANALAGREVYAVRERNVFQSFGAPRGRRRDARRVTLGAREPRADREAPDRARVRGAAAARRSTARSGRSRSAAAGAALSRAAALARARAGRPGVAAGDARRRRGAAAGRGRGGRRSARPRWASTRRRPRG